MLERKYINWNYSSEGPGTKGAERVLGECWESAGRVLGGHWEVPGRIFGSYWDITERVLEGYWDVPGRFPLGSWESWNVPERFLWGDESWEGPGRVLGWSWVVLEIYIWTAYVEWSGLSWKAPERVLRYLLGLTKGTWESPGAVLEGSKSIIHLRIYSKNHFFCDKRKFKHLNLVSTIRNR